MTVSATDVERRMVYHSPQAEGYTCWVGAWITPEGTIRVTFHQATGPLTGRPMAPRAFRETFGWPPPGLSPGYDMTGTMQQVITLDSADGGFTWNIVATEPFHTPMNGVMQGYCALPDGTVLRTSWGMYLPFYDVPQTGYVQRSTDGGETWGPPVVLVDPAKGIALPKRAHVLRDGRILVTGGYFAYSDEVTNWAQGLSHIDSVLWLSSDDGATWSEPIVVRASNATSPPTEESDAAELPDGRLLVIERASAPPPRWQTVLKPEGGTYVVERQGAAPFPHSGQPDVLATREGVVLHIASSNISWTADAGQTWTDLGLGTLYYPCSVQVPDGRILSFCHRGSDDPFDGSVDQQIEVVSFRLKVE